MQALCINGRVGQPELAEPDGCAAEKLATAGHQSSAVFPFLPVDKGTVEEWGLASLVPALAFLFQAK